MNCFLLTLYVATVVTVQAQDSNALKMFFYGCL